MKTYQIPNTDLTVSRLAYGTWHMGGSWDFTPLSAELKERANHLILTAVDHGINHIDLADIYTRGKSDEAVGYALAQNPGLRQKLVLQAKVGIIIPTGDDPGYYNFEYDHIVSAVEGTLRRLGTDYVDLLALHRPDPLFEPAEVARALDHLHQSGKVRYFGVSNHNAAQIALLQKHVDQPLVLNQLELNILHHFLISDGVVVNNTAVPYTAGTGTLDYCRLHDMIIQAWSPVAGGKLFNQQAAAENERAVANLIHQLASQYQTTPEAIAVSWLLRHPAPIQPIIGTLNADRLGHTVPADTVELTRIEWYRLLAAARGAGVP
ncbi:MAG TPA: aldo/keto reductase [Anaerolineae bacterium]|nr:aldo/keto reductase [Anaerolineae bacterium]